MESENDMDSDLQRSLDELDEQFDEQSNSASDVEDSDAQLPKKQNPKDKVQKGQVKHHLREKKSAYDQLLPPDEDVDSIPPFVVVVQGSKSSGKSSLIRSLVKNFVKHKVDKVNGTITLRSTKKQRITIIQCPTDLRAMIDLSKIADIVLLMIDTSLGFEMETFEFLSLLKCHGFPQVMGVLTHLDYYKDNKQLRKTKKKFKKRFEYEVGGNNKLFNVSKWENGLYPKIEVSKIARYIGTTNPHTIQWRLNHPYILIDRWQTEEDKSYDKDDEIHVEFFGYIRGSSYRMNGKMHLVGMGDFMIKQMEVISDPCPQYKKQQKEEEANVDHKQSQDQEEKSGDEEDEEENVGKAKQAIPDETTKKKKKRRTLSQNERIIYAPHCNLGTLSFEHTSGYVTIPHEYVKFTRKQKIENDSNESESEIEEGVKMVHDLQDMKQTINQKLRKRNGDFELFEGVAMEESDDEIERTPGNVEFGKKKREIERMKAKSHEMLIPNPDDPNRHNRQEDLYHLIYESKEPMVTHDCSKFHPALQEIDQAELKNLFVTGMEEDVLNENSEGQSEKEQKEKIEKILKQNVKKAKINEVNNFFQKGYYVKVVLEKVKYQNYLEISNSAMPVILTRINLGEDNLGFIKVNFRRHRWYTNLLKTNDPIIVSCGWRRYQTMITFGREDQNDRLRYLKYSPHYDFCAGVFYGNFSQQNTGCIFMQTIRNDIKKFRIAGSGVVMEMNKSFQIMKKVKLIGEPYKIFKNTAFIRGMFNSSLEVANYIGAKISTVSGIRGQIKKSLKEGGSGAFRATFEDKIVLSDIVFCGAWYRVILERFYNPVLNFGRNRLMKTKYELRIENGVALTSNPDSEYKNVDRVPQKFKPFQVPRKLEGKLPFKTLEKVKESKKERIKKAENASMPKLLSSDQERDVASLIQRLNTIKNQKLELKESKFKEKQRIKSARERPKQEYYESLKKHQKAQKMASLMRKNKREERKAQKAAD